MEACGFSVSADEALDGLSYEQFRDQLKAQGRSAVGVHVGLLKYQVLRLNCAAADKAWADAGRVETEATRAEDERGWALYAAINKLLEPLEGK